MEDVTSLPLYGFRDLSNCGDYLRLDIVSAQDLPRKSLGLRAPYAIATLHETIPHGNQIESVGGAFRTNNKTQVHDGAVTFEEECLFAWPLTGDVDRHNGPVLYLLVRLFDHHRITRDPFLGQVRIDLQLLPPASHRWAHATPRKFVLQKRSPRSHVHGSLTLKIGYVSRAELTGITVELPAISPAPSDTHSPASGGEEDGALPAGWSVQIDRNGRRQYVHAETRQVCTSMQQVQQVAANSIVRARAALQSVLDREAQEEDSNSSTGTGSNGASVGPSQTPSEGDATSGSNQASGPLPPGWVMSRTKAGRYWEERYTQSGRKFFVNHRTRTTQWEDPRTGLPALQETMEEARRRQAVVIFSLTVSRVSLAREAVPYSRDFARKKSAFRAKMGTRIHCIGTRLTPLPSHAALQNLTMLCPRTHTSGTHLLSSKQFDIAVSRDSILEDSFNAVRTATAMQMTMRMNVKFTGERGLDYGGPSREWFMLLSQEMFNPYYGLFEYSALDVYTLQAR
ncbi:uncharacterized protein MONBRDRAFT_29603, partial [Monosiga brevicollis MX1]